MNAQVKKISPEVASQFSRVKKAEDAVNQLLLEGFSVLSVELNVRSPIIWVQFSNRCRQLLGAQIGSKQTPNGKLCVFCTLYGTCQVRWQQVVK